MSDDRTYSLVIPRPLENALSSLDKLGINYS